MTRREFVAASAAVAGAPAAFARQATRPSTKEAPLFRISLAQWSLHRMLEAGKLVPHDFPAVAREQFGLEAVEYVNVFYADKTGDRSYFANLRKRAEDAGVRSLLIMVHREGDTGDPDREQREKTLENHKKWLEIAKVLGCHSIRVNARSRGSEQEQRNLVADGLRRLCELADDYQLNVLVENHGGLSSNGAWLAGVMQAVKHPRCGTLPDFGNFRIDGETWYDRYQGVQELMPFAKAVSAKSNDFDASGNETHTDFHRMMRVVLDAGYRGHVGIEYEGEQLPEPDGIKATKALLERVREALAQEPAYRR
jgi:sugar phosphate isomerase/epimerase